MYDPSVGRWLEEDPIGFDAGDADLYRYVGNDPMNAVDPTGLDAEEENRWTSWPAEEFWNKYLKGKGADFNDFSRGCQGLASIRLGNGKVFPAAIKNKHCFPTLQAAENYRKSIADKIAGGQQVAIFATQFSRNYLFKGSDEQLPAGKEIDLNNINWSSYDNFATLHEPDGAMAFWEWMNSGLSDPDAVVRHNNVDRNSPTNGLPSSYSHVLYCVVVIEQHKIAPPTQFKKGQPPSRYYIPPYGARGRPVDEINNVSRMTYYSLSG